MALRLHYFDLPGRAEPIRLALAIGGVEFEDVRFPREQWESLKPTMPFGQVPVLQVGDKYLAETIAILRYVGKLSKLYPEDPWTAAKVDEFIYLIDDFHAAARPLAYGKENVEENIAKLKSEVFPKYAALLQKTITANGGVQAVGGDVTIADLWLDALYNFATVASPWFAGIGADAFDAYPAVKGAVEKLRTNERYQAFKAKHAGK